ncbi:MAG: hypothetical protein KDD94_08560, partial [Calditrichaeota bacterium]|nr:hypothetical protein [Calditrichota bacterium]
MNVHVFKSFFLEPIALSEYRNYSSIFANEILSQIPYLKNAHGALKAINTVSDRILIAKLIDFMRGRADLSFNDEIDFSHKLDDDPNFVNNLLLAIDQLDTMEKSRIIGRIFECYKHQFFDNDSYMKLVFAVSNTSLPSIKEFIMYGELNYSKVPAKFENVELYKLLKWDSTESSEKDFYFELTDIGKWLQLIITNQSATYYKEV